MNVYDKLLVYKYSLENSIKCNLCLNHLDEPVISSCSHLFCISCIQRVDSNFVCPVCKQMIVLESLKKLPLHKNLIRLAKNVLNAIEQNNPKFIKSSNRKRKKISEPISLPDTEKLPEIVEIKREPVIFRLKGGLEKQKIKKNEEICKCSKKLRATTNDFGCQVNFCIEFQEKEFLNDDFKSRTIVPETPTKQSETSLQYHEEDSKNKSMIKSTTRMESILDLSTLRGKRSSTNTSTGSNETLNNTSLTFRNYNFSSSLLTQFSKEKVTEFSKMFEIKLCDDVSDETTHLLVQTDGDLVCGVTTKYLKAIVRKLWIVSIHYIYKCLESKSVLDFKDYEIQGDNVFGNHFGPSRSRLSTFPLFTGYEFLCLGRSGNESISTEDFFSLVKLSGAKIVNKAKDFSENSFRVVLFDEKNQKIDEKIANFMLKSAKIKCITLSWFFDSLASYSVRDIKQYAICT